MPKLTETTNDKMAAKRSRSVAKQIVNGGREGGKLHIEAAHEPTKSDPVFLLNELAFEEAKNALMPEVQNVVIPPLPAAEPVPAPVRPEALRTDKVAIIGTAPSSRLLAPFADPSWTIWACSPGNMVGLPRIDAWFEIHGNFVWPEHKHYGDQYIQWLKAQSFPLFMHDKWPTHDQGGAWIDCKAVFPSHRTFPHRALIERFGKDFFSSSFAWMMAYAIHLGAKEIALYGVDMASRDEYIQQRPGFYFFKREAEKLGIRVSAPNESDIMMSPGLYGYSELQPFSRKLTARKKEIADRIAPMQTEVARLNENITYLKGALEDIEYVQSIWSGVQDNS